MGRIAAASTRRVVAIVQARMGSSRLPGKVLADVGGTPMVFRVLDRVRAIRGVSEVVLATTQGAADRELLTAVASRGVSTFAGSTDDVLDRYRSAASQFDADVVMRITADCPLLDPTVSELVLSRYLKGDVDFASNVNPPTYPDGFDTWVFSRAALEKAWREAQLPSEREHVTPYIWKHAELFRLANVGSPTDLSAHRWTVDEPSDLEFVRRVYAALGGDGKMFGLTDVLALLAREPQLRTVNAGIGRDEGYAKSLRNDAVALRRSVSPKE